MAKPNTNRIQFYETGIDENKDRHCDLCGCFVNKFDRHRARKIYADESEAIELPWLYQDGHLERLSDSEFAEEFIEGNPYSKPDYDPKRFSSVLRYSRNNDKELSCKVTNDYLRRGVVGSGFRERDIKTTIADINSQISKFVVKRTAVFYRGMHSEQGGPLTKILDAALGEMEATGKPAVFLEKGFTSVSRDPETAKIYARAKDESFNHIYAAMVIEPDIPAMPLSLNLGTAANGRDKEVLLPSGMRYHILEIKKVHMGGGRCDYYVTMLATNRGLD